MTVDPGTEGFQPAALKPYVAALGVPCHYVEDRLAERAEKHMHGSSFSAFSARMRRGIMYRVARESGCNVLALAQHLDDIAQTFLMSMFNAGELRTMKAHYMVDAGDLRVIRPLVYCRRTPAGGLRGRGRPAGGARYPHGAVPGGDPSTAHEGAARRRGTPPPGADAEPAERHATAARRAGAAATRHRWARRR